MQTQEFYETDTGESETSDFELRNDQGESPFNEVDELDLAAELLGVTSEAELDNFLGKLLHQAAKAAGGTLDSATGRALGGLLKGAIHKALPAVGDVIDSAPPASVGELVGSGLASEAGHLFGLELEGLSQEDQEYQAAKQLVRLAGAAVSNAEAAPSAEPPFQAAKQALAGAAQSLAPGLLRPTSQQPTTPHDGHTGSSCNCSHARTGYWKRRGHTIILHGL